MKENVEFTDEVKVLKMQRAEEQLEVIKLMTEEKSRFMIIPSARTILPVRIISSLSTATATET